MNKYKVPRLSNPQLNALLRGMDQKLYRSSHGWSYKTGPHSSLLSLPATIRSLWKLGLLDANFDDPRGFGTLAEVDKVNNLDGARFPHSPDVQMLCVWTNWKGMEVLRYYGWIEDEETPKVIH